MGNKQPSFTFKLPKGVKKSALQSFIHEPIKVSGYFVDDKDNVWGSGIKTVKGKKVLIPFIGTLVDPKNI